MPERTTRRIDIAVLAGDMATACELMSVAGDETVPAPANGRSTWRAPDSRQVDLVPLTEIWAREAFLEARANPDAQGLPIIPLPYLVLMKLIASRFIDIGDVGRMLVLASDEDLEKVRNVISRFQPSLFDDLESLITLGKMEQELP